MSLISSTNSLGVSSLIDAWEITIWAVNLSASVAITVIPLQIVFNYCVWINFDATFMKELYVSIISLVKIFFI